MHVGSHEQYFPPNRPLGKPKELYLAKAYLYHILMVPTHLKSLQALELAVRTGSLKAGAQKLGITPAAFGQRIKALEEYLGFDLVLRGRTGLRPTNELAAAVTHLVVAFKELETAAEILDFQRIQEIHVAADSDWAELWLAPRLARFKADNPNILFCINGNGDVAARPGRADCEIWFGEPRGGRDEHVLFHDYLLPVSSPENATRIWSIASRLEGFPLLHLDCYRSDPASIGWPEWAGRYGNRTTALERGIRYGSVVRALDSLYANAGLLICGLALVEAPLADGRLSLPFHISQGAWTGQAYRASFRESAKSRMQLAKFRSWLLERGLETAECLRRKVAST